MLLPGLFPNSLSLLKGEGAGVPGARCTRGLMCQSAQEWRHTSIQGSGEHSDIPCAMALRLTSCSSRRRIPFCHRRLQISGSAEPVGSNIASAALTPATGARTTRLRRTQRPPPLPDKPCAACRRFDESLEAPLVLHTVHRSRGSSRPAISGARNAAASTASHPNVQ
jgi:hypothetical protein